MAGPQISRWYCPPCIGREEQRSAVARAARDSGRAQALHLHSADEPCSEACQLVHPCGASGPIGGGIPVAGARLRPFSAEPSPQLAAALAANARNGYGSQPLTAP